MLYVRAATGVRSFDDLKASSADADLRLTRRVHANRRYDPGDARERACRSDHLRLWFNHARAAPLEQGRNRRRVYGWMIHSPAARPADQSDRHSHPAKQTCIAGLPLLRDALPKESASPFDSGIGAGKLWFARRGAIARIHDRVRDRAANASPGDVAHRSTGRPSPADRGRASTLRGIARNR